MDGVQALMLGLVVMTVVISITTMAATMHGNNIRERYDLARLELDREKLTEQRSAEQQAAEVGKAKAEGYAQGTKDVAHEIRLALDAVKAPSVVVQR